MVINRSEPLIREFGADVPQQGEGIIRYRRKIRSATANSVEGRNSFAESLIPLINTNTFKVQMNPETKNKVAIAALDLRTHVICVTVMRIT